MARQPRDRKLQRVLMQFFKPENCFEVRKAPEEAEEAGRSTGNRCVKPVTIRPLPQP